MPPGSGRTTDQLQAQVVGGPCIQVIRHGDPREGGLVDRDPDFECNEDPRPHLLAH